MKSQSLSEIGIATHVPLICLNIFRLIGHLSILIRFIPIIMGYPIIFWDWRLGKPHRSRRQVRIDDDSFGEATGPALTGGVHFPLTGERVNTEHRNHHVFWNVTRLTAFHVLSQNRARSWSQLDIYIYIPIYILFIYLFIYLFVYFIHLFIYSFIYLFIHLFIYLSIYLVFSYLFIYISYPSIEIAWYIYICIYICI